MNPTRGTRMLVSALLIVLTSATTFAAGSKEIVLPLVELDLPETSYISPQSSPGVQDVVEFTAAVAMAENMVLKGLRLNVYNPGGTVVYTREERYPGQQPLHERALIQLGFSRFKSAFVPPETLTWAGKNSEGIPVPEGAYTLQVDAWDDTGRTGESSPHTVMVDNTPPTARVSAPYLVFSPNGDGNQDMLIIEQTGSREHLWTGTIQAADGTEVAVFTWESSVPPHITWDARISEDEIAPDGVYSYTLAATDRAGNSFSTSMENIRIDTRDRPISLSRDLAYISPNDNGFADVLTYTVDVPVQDGIIEWSISIHSASGSIVRRFEGTGEVPETVVFDGRNTGGNIVSEGVYSSRLSVLYENGNNPRSNAAPFEVDLTPPSVSVMVNPQIISPNGDGRQDSLTVYQETSMEDTWTGVVRNASEAAVRAFTWRGRADTQLVWDGKNEEGELVANGTYTYVLSARDRAGNFSEAVSNPFRVDVRTTPVSLRASLTHFSPNQTGVQDTVELQPVIQDPEGVTEVSVTVVDVEGRPVRTFTSPRTPRAFTWDGRTDAGHRAADGRYTAQLRVTYDNGNLPTAQAGPLTLDTEFPSLVLSADSLFFSPDDDGDHDTILIKQRNATSEQRWTGSFYDSEGTPVRTEQWRGQARDFEWDGRDADGNRLPDGTYTYQVSSTDQAGNKSQFTLRGITIDTRPTPAAVRLGSPAFSPNGNGVLDFMELTPVLEVRENIDNWVLEIKDSAGTVRRSYSGSGRVPSVIRFDGNDDSLRKLPEGVYTAHLSVLYRTGRNPSARSGEFTLDITPPRASVSVDNTIFSPNGDGRKDTVVFRQSGSEEREWNGTVQAPDGSAVRTFTWYGTPPETASWDGLSDSGTLVADGIYSYRLSATDRAGNFGQSPAVVFEKDTRETPLSVTAGGTHFSPNGNGVKDNIAVRIDVGMLDRIESFRFDILNRRGTSVYQRTGTSGVPREIRWDGKGSDGRTLPEGEYSARMQITYAHGNRPEATSGPFAIDVTAPTIQVSASPMWFSPDGDGRKDEIRITQRSSTEDLWEGAIVSLSERTVKSFFWRGSAESFSWDGTDQNGNTVVDGEYRYVVSATDKAGNTGEAEITGIRVDTRVASAFVNPSPLAISPTPDGVEKSTRINLYKSLSDGISSWRLVIEDQRGTVVRDLTGPNATSIPSSVIWDGKNRSGQAIDGNYTAKLTIEYEKGNLVEAVSPSPIFVDASPPEYTVSISPKPFSPDDDGVDDTVTIRFNNVRDASAITGWSLQILDPYERVFYERQGRGTPTEPIVWDGLSDEGELVQAAEDYTVVTTVRDSLGNIGRRTSVLPVDILVIRDGDDLKIRISSIQFPPNSADFQELEPAQAERNMRTLRRLAEILGKYSAYQIRIEGHAVSVYWANAARAEQEEEQELKPLSKARAEEVKKALVSLGITANRMTTVGMGRTQPVAPHGDLENRWKSRRVEFILIR